jgi:hypothetical protein
MATPLSRRPERGDGSAQAAVTISAVTEYLLPATMRGITAQAAAALGVLTGLWIALSPSFITLQHGGGVWVIIFPFILDAKFPIAAPMYWSNVLSGGVLVVLALAGLATVRRAAR